MTQYKRVVIVPYLMGSQSAKLLQSALKQHLNVPIIKVSQKSIKYQPRWTDYVINWGCSKEWPWINLTDKTGNENAVNKLTFFKQVTEHNKAHPNCFVNIPEWTTDANVVAHWVDTEQKTVVARELLTGHSGKGIKLIGPEGTTNVITYAPLYVQYKKKRHEYRVHFFKDGQAYTVIDVAQKKKRKGFENANTKIRNHSNGWVYCREDITEPADLRSQALNAAFASGLPFGAVDVIWNEKENKCYVLEINTAPGLTGTTLNNYVQSFVKDIKNA